MVSGDHCLCNITSSSKTLGLETVIKEVDFVVNSAHKPVCGVEKHIEYSHVLRCNLDNVTIQSGCPPATVLLSIACVILAFIAAVLYHKLRKSNQRPTPNAEG